MTKRSQRALAKLRGSAADVAEHNPRMDSAIYEQTRNMNPARDTTLKKAMRARRIYNGERPLSLKDEILTPREIRRKEKTGEPYPADHTLRHAGGSLAAHELLMHRFRKIDHVKTLGGKR